MGHTTLALFLAAAILVGLFEDSDRERLRAPMQLDRFRIASAVQIAAVVMLGPWWAGLVAAVGTVAAGLFHGAALRKVCFDSLAYAGAATVAGLVFELAGGDVGTLTLLDDLVPLVALAVAYLTVRALLLDVVGARENFEPQLVSSAGEAGLGAAIALFATGHPWNVIVLVPLALALHHSQLRLRSLQRETLRALETFANIVDERDPSTYRHSLRVAGYVDALARALRLPFSDIDRLRWAGRLHDLGKVAVDASLLRKRGGLDGAEWAAMRRHPRLSARLLQRFEFVAPQARAVELHHERVDGHGYYGVGGDDLPLASHFLIVADSFDAMTTDRPYRKGLSRDAALMEIEANAGTQFHPAVAKAFVAVQRGIEPAAVLKPEELQELRRASATYRLRLVGAGELKERPELLALGGVVLALAGLGFDQTWLTVAGGALALAGLGLRAAVQVRARRAAAALHRALGTPDERVAVFHRVVAAMSGAWHHAWAGLVAWDEDGLGGSLEAESGTGGPAAAALTSWLVREAESGRDAIVAPGAELGVEGVAVALPLRRDNSALVGFVAFVAPKLPPRHVELALLESLDDLGLALALKPELDRDRSEEPEPLETVADTSDFALVRFDER
ncbi:MAG TPA: HD domain-containing phosphohydrolase [Gaiellaceae bacterium]|nr:HD domain-containing phosphohydrolase [Gaiellaceae bacterium]